MTRYISRTFSAHLDQRVEILFLDLPVGPKAEVVRELADVLALFQVSTASLRRPLPSSRALSRFLRSTFAVAARPRRSARRRSGAVPRCGGCSFVIAPFSRRLPSRGPSREGQ